MNKLFSKIAALSVGLAMAIGVGVAVGGKAAKVARATDVSVSIGTYAGAHGWVNQTAYEEVVLDSNVTASSTGGSTNSSKYYTTDNSWRFYAGDSGVMTITTTSGNLTSVTLTFTTKDNGKMSYGSNAITSGTPVSVSGTSASFNAGSTSGAKGKVFVTAIAVSYSGGTPTPTPTLSSITVDASKAKTEYYVGDTASVEGVTVTANYSDDTHSDVTASATITANPATIALATTSIEYTATFNEKEDSDSIDVTVSERPTYNYEETELEVGKLLITTTYNEESMHYLPTATSSSAAPSAPTFTDVSEIDPANLWNVTKDGDNWVFKNDSDEYLAITGNGNNSVRVGSTSGSWTVQEDGSLQGANSRYLGVYNAQDWRSYNSSTHDNYGGSAIALKFYKVAEPEPQGDNMTIKDVYNHVGPFAIDYSESEENWFFAYNDNSQPVEATWSSSDSEIASVVTESGCAILTTLKPGEVTLTATAEGFKDSTATVTISAGTVEALEVTGQMTKTAYTTNDNWDPSGLTVSALYSTGYLCDVTSQVSWSYNPEKPADGVTSVVATATLGTESDSSEAQTVTVTVVHAGTADDPFTVAEALAKAAEIGPVGNKGQGPWVTHGIISRVTSAPAAEYWNATYYISDDGTQNNELQVYRGFYLENQKFDAETAKLMKAGNIVTVTGNITGSYGSEYCQGNYLLSIEEPETGDIDVIFEPASTSFEIGATGTFTATSNTAGVTFTWSVDNSDVLEVNASTGAYQAKALGVARVTATGSDGVKEGFAFVDFVVNGKNAISVTEARTIASSVASGQTTSYYVYVEGYVSEFATSKDQQGNPRAINIMALNGDEIMVYTNTGDRYNNFIEGLDYGHYIKVKANVQNYSGTYELVSPEKIAASYSAISLAFEILNQTDGVCENYDGKTDNKAAIASIWETLSGEGHYAALDQDNRDILAEANRDEKGTKLEQAMARYDYLTGKYELTNFIEGRSPMAFVNNNQLINSAMENDSTMIVIVVIAAVSTLSLAVLLVLKKKRHN